MRTIPFFRRKIALTVIKTAIQPEGSNKLMSTPNVAGAIKDGVTEATDIATTIKDVEKVVADIHNKAPLATIVADVEKAASDIGTDVAGGEAVVKDL